MKQLLPFLFCLTWVSQVWCQSRRPATIPAREAIQRIERLCQSLAERDASLGRLYYKGQVPMKASFDRYHSPAPTYEYVDAWGDWLYLRWQHTKDHFFNPHKAALDLSLSYLRGMKRVERSDVEYLEQGMQRWSAVEKRLEHLLAEHVELDGQVGSLLGQIRVLYLASWNLPRNDPSYLRMQAESEALEQQKEELSARNKVVLAECDELVERRLFSEIPGRDVGEAEGAEPQERP